MRTTLSLLAAAGAALSLAACGHNMEQRAATGGIAGAAVAPARAGSARRQACPGLGGAGDGKR